MGTFHDNLGELHGITVALELNDGSLAVGRCHEANDSYVLILDADLHQPGGAPGAAEAWLRNAARWGVFPKLRSVRFERAQVLSITPLNSIPTA